MVAREWHTSYLYSDGLKQIWGQHTSYVDFPRVTLIFSRVVSAREKLRQVIGGEGFKT